ncbi:hypothetical protein SAMN05444411_102169 [Lutibacter oricola]|uniref:Smr domain-containing protein n=1 Tax=Lutibacter oricola TaxID=762486 RepID=A0A1H2WDB8_9FLAO|nr:Smr/MutS family protein [Lutibacter oricola]SDW78541.1 hypothetical protein SAMN05444411_102169 [Lutibacter oricola]
MSLKVGDFVAAIDDVVKGYIIKVKEKTIIVEGEDGFPFEYIPKEVVVIKENQNELSKYSDISNSDLLEKTVEKPKRRKSQFKSDAKPEKQPPMEVDLHIEKLTKSYRRMDNYDIVNIQIDTAKAKLEFAIRNRLPKVVFIHGVGAGVLKTELGYLLRKYPVKWYAADFRKYGLGATEVYILQNPRD